MTALTASAWRPLNLARPVVVGLTTVLLAIAAYRLALVGTSSFAAAWGWGNGDLVGYTDGARRFLDTGSPYTPDEVAGPWALGPHSFIHPPAALPLFVPFLWLPWALWWVLPVGITVWGLWRLRPAMWTWPLIALALCWPRSTGAIIVGNSDLWVTAFLSAGAVIGWPLALVIIKPTFAPLAVIGIRDRRAWIGGAVIGSASLLLFLPLWLEWSAVIRNADLSFGYSLLNLPLVLIPVVAWLGRRQEA